MSGRQGQLDDFEVEEEKDVGIQEIKASKPIMTLSRKLEQKVLAEEDIQAYDFDNSNIGSVSENEESEGEPMEEPLEQPKLQSKRKPKSKLKPVVRRPKGPTIYERTKEFLKKRQLKIQVRNLCDC